MARPTITQTKTIEVLALALKIEPPQPLTDREAGFVIDDLVARERKERRLRQRTLSFNAVVQADDESRPPRG